MLINLKDKVSKNPVANMQIDLDILKYISID